MFFAPQGRQVAPMGVKFARRRGPLVPSSVQNFFEVANRCNDKGVGPPKLKFLVRFDQNVEYKPPRGVSLTQFSQNLQSLYPVSIGVPCFSAVMQLHQVN